MKTELKECLHCSRMNWHENSYCTWCYKPLPSMRYLKRQRVMNQIIIWGVIVAFISLATAVWVSK